MRLNSILGIVILLIAVVVHQSSGQRHRTTQRPTSGAVRGGGSFGSQCNFQSNAMTNLLGATAQCDPKFECMNGKCDCKSPKHQVYCAVRQECKSLVGGPCSTSDYESDLGAHCVENAQCVNKGYYEACECAPGYTENSRGKCSLGVGADCTVSLVGGGGHGGNTNTNELGFGTISETVSSNSNNNNCDAALTCRAGKCDCADELEVYDLIKKKCRGLVGAACTADGEEDYCVERAYCNLANTNLRGRCSCRNKWDEWSDRFCERFEDAGLEETRYQTTEDYRSRLRSTTASPTTIRPGSAKRYYRRGRTNGQQQGMVTSAPPPYTTRGYNRNSERMTTDYYSNWRTTDSSYSWRTTSPSPYYGRDWDRTTDRYQQQSGATRAPPTLNYTPDNCPKMETSDCSYENCKLTGCTDGKICCPKPCGGNWCVRGIR